LPRESRISRAWMRVMSVLMQFLSRKGEGDELKRG